MDNFGDLFGGLGEVLGDVFDGGDAGAEGAWGLTAFLSPEARRRGETAVPFVYERYLCGGPRELNINDR